MISAFRGKYYFLSNFYAAPVVWDGVSYKNNEAAFQSAKVGREYRQEFAELTASEAKKLGMNEDDLIELVKRGVD